MAAKRNATGLTLASDLQRKTLNDEELVSYVIKYVQWWKLSYAYFRNIKYKKKLYIFGNINVFH